MPQILEAKTGTQMTTPSQVTTTPLEAIACDTVGNVPEPTELLAQVMSKLVDFVTQDKQETPSAKVWDPDPFDGSNPKKLQGFLLKCKLNFRA